MFELRACPNQEGRGDKIHSIVVFDIFWNDCSPCGGSESIKQLIELRQEVRAV
jgi:hypothetical protein